MVTNWTFEEILIIYPTAVIAFAVGFIIRQTLGEAFPLFRLKSSEINDLSVVPREATSKRFDYQTKTKNPELILSLEKIKLLRLALDHNANQSAPALRQFKDFLEVIAIASQTIKTESDLNIFQDFLRNELILLDMKSFDQSLFKSKDKQIFDAQSL